MVDEETSSKGTKSLVTPIPITPKSFKEVKSTGLKDLKALCKNIGIHIGGVGREGLEVLLCKK